QPEVDRRVHRRRPRAVRPHLRRQRRGPMGRQPAEGIRMSTLTATEAPLFARVSGSRKVKNGLATGFVVGSFLVALVPLVWLLWTVIGKGIHVVLKAGWWTGTQRSKTFTDSGGGVLHAIVGTLEQVA